MDNLLMVVACIASGGLFFVSTYKLVGIMQQCGYKNGGFYKWLKRKDNLFFNRLSLLSGMLLLFCALCVLAFSPFGTKTAKLLSAIPFFVLCLLFCVADAKYALKIPVKNTGRTKRLCAVYLIFILGFSYIFLALLYFVGELVGASVWSLFAFVPFALTPLALPFLLGAANKCSGVFENARNKKYVARMGQVLDQTDIVRVAVVGSYGKTSVKNILKTLLEEKYSVVSTPESYNTPVGIAKTVESADFEQKQVFIAEMGARKAGDVAELCALVKPDYALFTGVCAQHIESFGSLDKVFEAKSEVIAGTKKTVVCGAALQEKIAGLPETEKAKCSFAVSASEVDMQARKTVFSFCLGEQTVRAETKLLGDGAVENVLLAATLAAEMGLTAEELERGISKLDYVPHRLQLMENDGIYVLDDSYNCSEKSAASAIAALRRFEGKKFVVTPGIVEGGILEEALGRALGARLVGLDGVFLVGDTLVGAVKEGYLAAGGDKETVFVFSTLELAAAAVGKELSQGDAVLFLNDLPDAY